MRAFGLVVLAVLAMAGRAQAECKVRHADLPITMVGMSAMIPASINGKSVRLELDSGSFATILDVDEAKALGLQLFNTDVIVEGVGGRDRAQLTYAKQFSLAGVEANRNTAFLVMTMPHGSGAVGVLGEDVLSVYDVEYDLANGLVRLMQIHDCGDYLAHWAKDPSTVSIVPIAPVSQGRYHIWGTVLVNGQPVRAMFDTGASHSLISAAAAARAGVHTGDEGVTATDTIGGAGRHLREAWVGSFSEIQIGDEKIKNTSLMIADKGRFADAEMLIGADFFLSHHVLVARSKDRMYFTYSGGRVFKLDGPPPAAPGEAVPAGGDADPASAAASDAGRTAAEIQRRGSANLARRDYQGALADFEKAAQLAPEDATIYFDRARAHAALKQRDAEAADLDRAIKLRPGYAQALLWRADLNTQSGHASAADADLTAALQAPDASGSTRLAAAMIYGEIRAYEKGIALVDRLIAGKPSEATRANAFEVRCDLGRRWGRDLDRALSDCETVLRLRGRNSAALEQRGLVRLRRGETALALADFDAALKLQPKFAEALYARGLAKRRLGQAAPGEADLLAAKAIDPKIGETFTLD